MQSPALLIFAYLCLGWITALVVIFAVRLWITALVPYFANLAPTSLGWIRLKFLHQSSLNVKVLVDGCLQDWFLLRGYQGTSLPCPFAGSPLTFDDPESQAHQLMMSSLGGEGGLQYGTDGESSEILNLTPKGDQSGHALSKF